MRVFCLEETFFPWSTVKTKNKLFQAGSWTVLKYIINNATQTQKYYIFLR